MILGNKNAYLPRNPGIYSSRMPTWPIN